MAIEMYTTGPVLIKWGDNASQTDLGIARNGVPWRIEPRWEEIPADDYAGESGFAADYQFMGAIATLQFELTKYEVAGDPKVPRPENLSTFDQSSTTPGTLPVYGKFMRQEAMYGTLVLSGVYETKTFTRAMLRLALEANSATRYRSYFVGFQCEVDNPTDRVLYTNSHDPGGPLALGGQELAKNIDPNVAKELGIAT